MKVGFIGLGIMGSRMASRLIKAGHELTVFNRDVSKSSLLAEKGAKVANTSKSVAENSEVVITMLSTPEVVNEMAFGENGFVSAMSTGTVWINCSTINPEAARSFGANAQKVGVTYLDAPVAGTKQPAENGELVFFVGGEKEAMEKATPLFEVMGKKTIHLGEVGSGSSLKLLVNLMLAQSMVAFSETFSLGKKLGISEDVLFNILPALPVTAPFIQNLKEKLRTEDEEANFPLKWMLKDIWLALDETKLKLSTTEEICKLFEKANSSGKGDHDFSSIFHLLNT